MITLALHLLRRLPVLFGRHRQLALETCGEDERTRVGMKVIESVQ